MSSVKKLLFMLQIVLIISIQTSEVQAVAGDAISSTATITFQQSGATIVETASSIFIEDRKINFNVTEMSGSVVQVITDMTDAVLPFVVTNTGNSIHDFLLTTANTSPNPYATPNDSFDPVPGTVRVFVENGDTPGYQLAEDTAVFIDELLPNVPQQVYVIADMPSIVADDVAVIALIAQAADGGVTGAEGSAINADDNGHISPAGIFSNGTSSVPGGAVATTPDLPGTMQTVFNDPPGLNSEDISSDLNQDVAANGQHSDVGVYQVIPPLVLIKTVTVIDTLGANDPHQGSTLRYQIEVRVAGEVALDNLIISDVIPVNTTYTDGSITLNDITQTDSGDAPLDYTRAINNVIKPVASLEIDLSRHGTVSVPPGSTNVITFEVTIN